MIYLNDKKPEHTTLENVGLGDTFIFLDDKDSVPYQIVCINPQNDSSLDYYFNNLYEGVLKPVKGFSQKKVILVDLKVEKLIIRKDKEE